MSSRIVRDRLIATAERLSEQAQGLGQMGMRMSSHRAVSSRVANVAALPVVRSDATLQDSSGNFYFLPGYTHPLAGEAFGPGLGLPFSEPE